MSDRKTCHHCQGSGSLPPYDVYDTCRDCKGTGWLQPEPGHLVECDCGSTPADRIRSLEARNAELEKIIAASIADNGGVLKEAIDRTESAEARCAEYESRTRNIEAIECAQRARAEAAEARCAELQDENDRLITAGIKVAREVVAAEARAKVLTDALQVCLELPGDTVRMTWLRNWAREALQAVAREEKA